jgi:hypothetical protein
VNLGEEAGSAMSRYGRKAAEGSSSSEGCSRPVSVSACGHRAEHYWAIGGLLKFLGLMGWKWSF